MKKILHPGVFRIPIYKDLRPGHSNSKKIKKGYTRIYVNGKDIANHFGFEDGEWETYDPQKHRNIKADHIHLTRDDIMEMFPDEFGFNDDYGFEPTDELG